MQLNSLKSFIRLIKQRIPLNVKIVAEIRLMWADIVGENMAVYSQPFKCEYIPKKNEQVTEKFNRRLLVYVKNDIIKTAMTSYASLYLEKIPKKFRIHSLRFQYTNMPLVPMKSSFIPQQPVCYLSEEEKQNIVRKVQKVSLSPELEKTMIEYLITHQNIKK